MLSCSLLSLKLNVYATCFNTTPNKNITIDFYRSPNTDPSGYGEGKFYIISKVVTTDANGHAHFVVPVTGELNGQFITATATSAGFGASTTGEFSNSLATTSTGSNRTASNPVAPRLASR